MGRGRGESQGTGVRKMKTLKLLLRNKVNKGNIDGMKQRDERVMELIPVGWKDLDGYLKMGRIKLTLMGLKQILPLHCQRLGRPMGLPNKSALFTQVWRHFKNWKAKFTMRNLTCSPLGQ